ncbi:hypothetical protein FOFC_06229 [Fusarium oxysporum]|nr:hypothetical protein FOFC_06229 [Fusarium oxysporum]
MTAEVDGLVAAAGQFVDESIKIYQLCKSAIFSLQHVIDGIHGTPVLRSRV